MIKRKKAKVRRDDLLSVAENYWLFGGDEPDGFTPLDRFFVWCLSVGDISMHHGRAINAEQLLDQYGHLVTPERVAELREQLADEVEAEAEWHRNLKSRISQL
jgi:hypothetical protein